MPGIRHVMSYLPVVKILTTTIPMTFFDFSTDVVAVYGYAQSPALPVRITAWILGKPVHESRGLGKVAWNG